MGQDAANASGGASSGAEARGGYATPLAAPDRASPSFTRSTSCPTTTSGAHPCASQRSAAKSACSRTAPPPLLKLAAIPRVQITLRRQTLRQQHRVAFQFHVEIRPPDPPPPAPRSPRRSDTSPGSARPRHTPRGRATDKRPAPGTPPRTPPRAPAPATPRAASDDAGSPPPAARSTPPPARRSPIRRIRAGASRTRSPTAAPPPPPPPLGRDPRARRKARHHPRTCRRSPSPAPPARPAVSPGDTFSVPISAALPRSLNRLSTPSPCRYPACGGARHARPATRSLEPR